MIDGDKQDMREKREKLTDIYYEHDDLRYFVECFVDRMSDKEVQDALLENQYLEKDDEF